MKYLLYTIYVLLLFGLSFGFFAQFPLWSAIPNLVFLGLIGLLITNENIGDSLFVALLGGVFWEVSAGYPFGSFTFGFILAALLIFFINSHVVSVSDRLQYLPLVLIIGQVVLELWVIGFSWLAYELHLSLLVVHPVYWSYISLFRFIYNLLLLYPVYLLAVLVDNLARTWVRRRSTK